MLRERRIEKLRAGTLATHLSDGESAADHVPWAASIWMALPDPLFSCLSRNGGLRDSDDGVRVLGFRNCVLEVGPGRFDLAIQCPAADERAEPRQIFVGEAVFSRESFAYNEITESSSSTNGLRRSIVSRMRSRSETLTVWLNEIRSARACRTRSCVTDMTGASDDRFLFSLAI
jgi:hypothetical protein